MPDRAVMAWEVEARVSDIHIIEWTATVGGQPVHQVGIGNTADKVEWGKHGYASAILFSNNLHHQLPLSWLNIKININYLLPGTERESFLDKRDGQ